MWHLMHRQIVMTTMSPRWSVGTLLLITEVLSGFSQYTGPHEETDQTLWGTIRPI